jgi:hypothetical protein
MSDPAFTRGVFDQHRFMRYLNPPPSSRSGAEQRSSRNDRDLEWAKAKLRDSTRTMVAGG